jgi:ABC-2 type transport system permease protein
MGFLDQQVANPWRVSATTTWPRAILQCYFFVLLGSSVTDSRAFAFEGSVVLILTLPTSISISAVPMTDKQMGTFHRIQLGRTPVAAVMALRSLPWLVDALVMVVVSMLAVGALTSQLPLAFRLLALSPLLLLMALTNAVAGLAVASFAVGRNVDVLLGNALMYLIIAAGGIIVPPGRLPWLDDIGRVLPLRNGLMAVRAIVNGGPWATHLLAELAVGLAWGVLAIGGYSYRTAQARRKGVDAFA